MRPNPRASTRPGRPRRRAYPAPVAMPARHAPRLVQIVRDGAVPLEALEIGIHAGELGQRRHGQHAERFEHAIVDSVRDDEDAHWWRTGGELAVSGRTRQFDVSQRAADRFERLGGLAHDQSSSGWIADWRIGIPDDCKRGNSREMRVLHQDFETSCQLFLSANGHDFDVGMAEMISESGLKEQLLVASLNDEELEPRAA